MSKSLMTRRKFAPLFFCQFFAAFGDNFLKAALSFLVAAQITGAKSGALITLAGAVFIAPFFLLSGLGGELADRYDKALMAQRIKFVEMGAAALAVVGFGFHSVILLFVALFLFGFAVTQHADRELFSLRRPGESGYKNPHGGLYRFVSCPNYLGEILEWCGWALATWSLAGLAFALWTIANLVPRARAHHRWYRTTFSEYPAERRAVVPFVY